MDKRTLFLVILIEGFLTIAVEILSIRQMIPFVGSNILNTSLLIGVFLLALALGYYRGGMVDGDYSSALLVNLFKSFFFLSFGLSYPFLSALFFFFSGLLGLLIFAVCIMAPIVFFLGQTIPILTNLIKNERNGKISGQLLFVSTFGSFAGSIITSVLLLNYLGVNATVFIVVFLLVAVIALLAGQESKKFSRPMLGVFLLLPVVAVANTNYLFEKTNNYSNIRVGEKNSVRFLAVNDSLSSSYNTKTGVSDFAYIKKIQSYVRSLSGAGSKSVLVLGAGGFTVSLGDDANQYTYVDIDQDLQEVSEKVFLKKKINGHFVHDDARHFLLGNKEKFDVVIVDVFSNRTATPSSFVTAEFYASVARSLSKDGVLIVNTIAKPMFKDAFTRKLDHTISTSFDCQISPVTDDLVKSQNVLYACVAKVGRGEDIYTDNLTNLFELAESR